jgi:Ca2+/Na+ antiporter
LSWSEFDTCADEVAGATLIAASTGCPELFAAVADTFFYHNNIGLGTVVGSGVFNLLFTVGVLGALAREPIPMDTDACLRAFFVAVVIAWAWYAVLNEKIEWFEALGLLIWYVIYIAVLLARQDPQLVISKRASLRKVLHEMEKEDRLRSHSGTLNYQDSKDASTVISDPVAEDIVRDYAADFPVAENIPILKVESRGGGGGGGCAHHVLDVLSSVGLRIWNVVKWPWHFIFSITVPDCESERWANWFVLTLLMSIVWTAGLCWLTIDRTSLIGCSFGAFCFVLFCFLFYSSLCCPTPPFIPSFLSQKCVHPMIFPLKVCNILFSCNVFFCQACLQSSWALHSSPLETAFQIFWSALLPFVMVWANWLFQIALEQPCFTFV